MNELLNAIKVSFILFLFSVQFVSIAVQDDSNGNPGNLETDAAPLFTGSNSLPYSSTLFSSPKIFEKFNEPVSILGHPRQNPLIPGVETTCKVNIRYSDGNIRWISSTLLSPEWAIVIDSWANDKEKDSPKVLYYTNSDGTGYFSNIDKYILLDEEMQKFLPQELHHNKYHDFRIAFAHLDDPIDIKFPEIDMRSSDKLLSERAVIVGHDWPSFTTEQSVGDIHEGLSFEYSKNLNVANSFYYLLNCSKIPICFSLYSVKDHVSLVQVLMEIQHCIGVNINQLGIKYPNQDIFSFLPYGNNLNFREDRFHPLTCKLALELCTPMSEKMKDAPKAR